MLRPRHRRGLLSNVGLTTKFVFAIAVAASSLLLVHSHVDDAAPARRVCGDASAARVEVSPTLALAFCENGVVRVVRTPAGSQHTKDAADAMVEQGSLMTDPSYPEGAPVQVHVDRSKSGIIAAASAKIRVVVNTSTEALSFFDVSTGSRILGDLEHSFTRTTDPGDKSTDPVFVVEQSWEQTQGALYGGGEFQSGILDFTGAPVELVQFNTEAIIPFFVSTQGYGLLWDNPAWTMLNPPSQNPLLTVPKGSANKPVSATWTSTARGNIYFFAELCPDYGCQPLTTTMTIKLTSNDTQEHIIVEDWRQLTNLPDSMVGVARNIRAGATYTVEISSPEEGTRLYVQDSSYNRTKLRSRIGKKVDYYFMWDGPTSNIDGAVKLFRHVTGEAPMFADWAYGFWQCKEHYHTQEELLDAAATFRKKKIPVDAIVQDWHYWGDLGWGPQWDPKIYPDPAGMVKNLTEHNMHIMVSVWSKFDKTTTFFKNMSAQGFMIGASNYYDVWNPAAREQFYQFSKAAHFDIGVDALWLDATEPEGFPHENQTVHGGSANQVFNTYSLMTTRAISDGLRRDYPHAQGRRVFSLTRSSFAGQQRNGAVLWSGDIAGQWDSLRRQVAASLNFQLSGMPYWSEDIGGFFRPSDQYTSPDYLLLMTRWFQFGVFTPIFRVHGGGSNTELWNYGQTVQDNIVQSAIRFRYRLFPYTYSGFWRVANESWTMQRGMGFDFAADPAVWGIADQFMYGSSFLVAPMVTNASSRDVYLPHTQGGWTSFYSGVTTTFLPAIVTATPTVREIPLFVRAGSIVLLGPDQQYTGESKTDPTEVRIYPGADGSFTLYEDDGLSAASDDFSTINFSWEDESRELIIGERSGNGFKGMLKSRTFEMFVVSAGHGVGVAPASGADKIVTYDGSAVKVHL